MAAASHKRETQWNVMDTANSPENAQVEISTQRNMSMFTGFCGLYYYLIINIMLNRLELRKGALGSLSDYSIIQVLDVYVSFQWSSSHLLSWHILVAYLTEYCAGFRFYNS